MGLPFAAFSTAALALHAKESRVITMTWWLNILLVALYLLVDVLALLVLKVKPGHPVAIMFFQVVLVLAPAIANIRWIRRSSSAVATT